MLTRYGLRRKHVSFVLAEWLMGFIMWGTLLAVSPVLVPIGQELRLAYSQMGLVFSLPVLMLAVFAFPGGVLADRIGPRRIGATGGILIGVGGLLRATSTDIFSLLLFSAVFGVGWGLSLPTLPKVVGGWFDSKVSGTVTGIYTVGIYVGAGIATAVTFSGSWRGALLSWGVISILIAILWWAVIRDPVRAVGSEQVSVRSVLRNRNMWIVTVMFFFGANVTFYTLTGWLPTILTANFAPERAAFIASLLSFFAAGTTLAIPILSDRIRRRRPFMVIGGIAGAVASYFVFSPSLPITAAAVAVLGISISTIFVTCLILPIELVPKEMVGSATGLMLLAYTGGVIGPWVAGVARDLSSGFTLTIIMLIASFAITAGLSLLLPETGKSSSGPS